MIPSRFDYVAPSTLDDAVTLLREHGGEAKVLSGGQSLIPMLKLRLATPTVLVDINRIPGLDYVEERDGALHIGALAREAELARSRVGLLARYPLLYDTASVIADPIVRTSASDLWQRRARGSRQRPSSDDDRARYRSSSAGRAARASRRRNFSSVVHDGARARRDRDGDRDPRTASALGGAYEAGTQGRRLRHGSGSHAGHARRQWKMSACRHRPA